MSEDLPAHPSLIGEWGNTPPWSEVLDSDKTSIDKSVNPLDCDARVSFLTPSNGIDRLSHILLQQNAILCGDAMEVLRTLPGEHFSCCITSPPYWHSLCSGKHPMLGAERDPNEYVSTLTQVFREVRRALIPAGTLWLVIGDAYAPFDPGWWEAYNKINQDESSNPLQLPGSFKPNDTMGMPWRVALALQNDGWYLRSDIIWSIPNHPLEANRDRPARIHNYIFLLAKSEKHLYNIHSLDTVSQRTVWEIPTILKSPIQYTVFPEQLVERCMRAGSKKDDVVLDPFFGSGTVGIVAKRLKRRFVGIEIDPKTANVAGKRIRETG